MPRIDPRSTRPGFLWNRGFLGAAQDLRLLREPWHRLGSSTQCGSLPGAADRRSAGFAPRRTHSRGSDGDHPRPASPSTTPIASHRDPGQSSRCPRAVCLVWGGTEQVRYEKVTSTEAIIKLDGPVLTVVDSGD